MLIQTANLIGRPLDWAVAKCEKPEWLGNQAEIYVRHCGYSPSTNWVQAGPIIDREDIGFKRHTSPAHGNHISAVKWNKRGDTGSAIAQGETNLVAAMRCYVLSRLGETVEVPGEIEKPAIQSVVTLKDELLSALIGAEKCIVKSLPHLPADKEAVFCGEWLADIRETITKVTGKPYPSSGATM